MPCTEYCIPPTNLPPCSPRRRSFPSLLVLLDCCLPPLQPYPARQTPQSGAPRPAGRPAACAMQATFPGEDLDRARGDVGDERDWSPSWRGPPLCACVCESPCKCASASAYLPPCVTVSAAWKRLLSARNSACLYNDRGKDVSSTGRSSLHSSWRVRSDGGRDWLMTHGKHRRGRPIHHPPFTTLPVTLPPSRQLSIEISAWRPGAGLARRACVLGISWYPTVSAWPLRAKTWGTTRRRPCKQSNGQVMRIKGASPTSLMDQFPMPSGTSILSASPPRQIIPDVLARDSRLSDLLI
ncbi:hypothetical protein LCI18_010328 [Fusarium solani-melongenae]|uniref:Uncharacterized protein n=1 Tax=Fusarium solani subsp. cucurbitae TaxID=2747967 RepID=A0ACD3ZH29_FUSSC|nr:hypothetical protein LCI18_010328 [Fusarium solani-melongenae]